nr:ThuA domain-containing protein [Microbacterium hydrocarbonoxydans]
MSSVLLFSGGADYSDPWHPFAETTAIVSTILTDAGHEVAVVDTVDALSRAISTADLLVVNAGGGPAPHPLDERLASVLDGYRGPLLALHVAATLLPEHDEWEVALGGRWVRGVSMHPERGSLHLRAASASPPLGELTERSTVDEAYSWLRVAPDAHVGLVHAHGGEVHPACWTLERDGRRTGYSSLGHDAEAYASPVAGEVIRRLVIWLLSPSCE